MSKIGNSALNLVQAKFLIWSFDPGSWNPNWLQGNAKISSPICDHQQIRIWSHSRHIYNISLKDQTLSGKLYEHKFRNMLITVSYRVLTQLVIENLIRLPLTLIFVLAINLRELGVIRWSQTTEPKVNFKLERYH